MSRFILGDCVRVMATFPDNAVDFILTDPPYLVGFRDRSGRTIAGDKTDEWLQPACNEMYRVLKKDALMVSFYGWHRIDRFMAAWKRAGFSVVGHLVFTKNYTSKSAYVAYRHECAYILAKGSPARPRNPLPDVLGWKYSGNRHHPTEKPVTSLQPLIESFTHPNAIVLDPFTVLVTVVVLPVLPVLPVLLLFMASPGVPLAGRAVVNGASEAVSALAGFHP